MKLANDKIIKGVQTMRPKRVETRRHIITYFIANVGDHTCWLGTIYSGIGGQNTDRIRMAVVGHQENAVLEFGHESFYQ